MLKNLYDKKTKINLIEYKYVILELQFVVFMLWYYQEMGKMLVAGGGDSQIIFRFLYAPELPEYRLTGTFFFPGLDINI